VVENPSALDRRQLPALTGLRFFAAFFVLFSHACHTAIIFSDSKFWFSLGNICPYLGMSLFFVLSGFVIHYNYGALFQSHGFLQATYTFGVARFARIYPLFLFFLLIALALAGFSGLKLSYTLPFYATLTQSWAFLTTDLDRSFFLTSFYPHSWSISTEVFFYLTYPLLVTLVFRLRKPTAVLVSIALFVSLCYTTLGALFFSSHRWAPRVVQSLHLPGDSTAFVLWLAYFSPGVRLLEFCLGCLVAQLHVALRTRPISRRERWLANLAIVLTGLIAIALHVFSTPVASLPPSAHLTTVLGLLRFDFLYAPAVAVLIFYVARYETVLSRALSCSPVVMLGEASFSVYILHPYILSLFHRSDSPPLSSALLGEWCLRLVLGIALTLILSFGTYRVLEVPARRWLRNILSISGPLFRVRCLRLGTVSGFYLVPCLGLLLGWNSYQHYLPDLYYQRGLVKSQRGDWDGAIVDYSQAIGGKRGFPERYYQRSLAELAKGDAAGAYRDLDEVIRQHPRYAPAYMARSKARQALGDAEGARADLACARRLDPNLMPAH
jgi:peptidoglycan/LPS O-acetylase OafA/YrhL